MDTTPGPQLFLQNILLGRIELRSTEALSGDGFLVPTSAYPAARPFLQTLTTELSQRHVGSDPLSFHRALVAAQQALNSDGFELRTDAGTTLPTTFLMVSDFYPLDCNSNLLGTALPLLVTFTLAQP